MVTLRGILTSLTFASSEAEWDKVNTWTLRSFMESTTENSTDVGRQLQSQSASPAQGVAHLGSQC